MKKKSLFTRFPATFGVATISVYVFYKSLMIWINPIPEKEKQHQTMTLKIIGINQSPPQFLLKGNDGTTIEANFPYDLMRSGARQYLIDPSTATNLRGCNAEFEMQEIKTLISSEHRVLGIRCGDFQISRNKLISAYENSNVVEFRLVKIFAITFALWFAFFFDSRRNND